MQRLVASVALLLIASPYLAADELPDRITIATWNLEWFYDHYTGDNGFELGKKQSAPNREEWEWKLSNTAAAIAKMNPTILCLQEVESRSTVMKLVKRLKEEHKLEYKIAFVEGTDYFTEQDVCVLAQSGLIGFGCRAQSKEMYKSKQYYNLSKHLFCDFEWGSGDDVVRLTLLNIHTRTQPEQTPVRIRQAKLAHYWLADKIKAGQNVVIIGDTNTEFPLEKTAAENDIGILRGWHTPEKDDDLFDCHELLKPEDRPTHIIHKSFDRIFMSGPMRQDDPKRKNLIHKATANRKDLNTRGKEQDKDHWDIYYQIPQDERDISDHFPVLAEFEVK